MPTQIVTQSGLPGPVTTWLLQAAWQIRRARSTASSPDRTPPPPGAIQVPPERIDVAPYVLALSGLGLMFAGYYTGKRKDWS